MINVQKFFPFALLMGILLAGCSSREKYNVLFITIDDLRPQLGCYGDEVIKSPNLDRLAEQGMVFDRAYCQTPLCGPSRTSFLSGYYPGTTGAMSNDDHIRDKKADAVTLPQLFKNNGYISTGLFKNYHLVGFDPQLFQNQNDTASWSIPHWLPERPCWGPYGDSIYQKSRQICLERGPISYQNLPRSLAYEAPDVADSLLSDGETACQAVKYLRQFGDKPFFMAVGFYNPHLPFVAPKKYWDLYGPEDIQLPENQHAPEGLPANFLPDMRELRSYTNIPGEGPISEIQKKELLHGYMASVSYIDAQAGLILDELDRLGLSENTIVVVISDHGYQIGEHNLWCKKHTQFDLATRVPCIMYVPGLTGPGSRTSALVELVDLYPTLAELCGLVPPGDLDGKSLVPLMKDPGLEWSRMAYSVYGRNRNQQSIKTTRYNFNRRNMGSGPFFELYDHQYDPHENFNIAPEPEFRAVVDSLNRVLDTYHADH